MDMIHVFGPPVACSASQDSVLERHLYCVSIHRPGEVRRLTAPGYSHSVDMSPDCLMLTTVFSSVNSLPGCQVGLPT